MPKSLLVSDLEKIIRSMKKFMTEKEYNEMRIVVGDDDELNAIHNAWGYSLIVNGEHEYKDWLNIAYGGAEKVIKENKYTLFIG